MSIEQDIQQDFKNEYQKAVLNLIYTNYYLVDQMNDVFKKHDITRQQYNVLRILRGQHPGHASVNLIKERMLDKMSDASRIVERLRLKELITRENCIDDKRCVEVKITARGLQLLEEMQPTVDGFELLLSNLTEPETRQLNQLLDKIRAAHKRSLSDESGDQNSEEKISTLASFKI
ncbi:MAG TPA: MarR family transcriptional regulator [Ohtaekwangia sp.]